MPFSHLPCGLIFLLDLEAVPCLYTSRNNSSSSTSPITVVPSSSSRNGDTSELCLDSEDETFGFIPRTNRRVGSSQSTRRRPSLSLFAGSQRQMVLGKTQVETGCGSATCGNNSRVCGSNEETVVRGESDLAHKAQTVQVRFKPGGAQVTREANTNMEINCPICMETIRPSEMVMKCPKNAHYFHKKCLTSWMVHQQKQQQVNSLSEEISSGSNENLLTSSTCPVCRDHLSEHAAKLSTYLNNPARSHFMIDERGRLEKLFLRLRIYFSLFFSHRISLTKIISYSAAFFFGLLKGFSLKPWTFAQDVVYFTLPYRMRVITSLGYVFGVLLKGAAILVTNLRKGVHPTKNLSTLIV